VRKPRCRIPEPGADDRLPVVARGPREASLGHQRGRQVAILAGKRDEHRRIGVAILHQRGRCGGPDAGGHGSKAGRPICEGRFDVRPNGEQAPDGHFRVGDGSRGVIPDRCIQLDDRIERRMGRGATECLTGAGGVAAPSQQGRDRDPLLPEPFEVGDPPRRGDGVGGIPGGVSRQHPDPPSGGAFG
jgi:hypothetical protein